MKAAPIALFVYNRPAHTMRTIEALQKNDLAAASDLYVFADGPKANTPARDLLNIEKVRSMVSGISGFRSVNLIFSEVNKGLSRSLTGGINKIFEKEESLVIVEDDILTSRYFLSFCNEALDKYKDDEKVMGISGYTYPVEKKGNQAYFLRTGACWGWATWRHAWQQFSFDAVAHLEEIKSRNLVEKFDFDGTAAYYKMLHHQVQGKIDSWAICWYASIFLAGGLVLFPSQSLTINTGMDGSGTHYKKNQEAAQVDKDFTGERREWNWPAIVEADPEMKSKLNKYFSRVSASSLKEKIKRLLIHGI